MSKINLEGPAAQLLWMARHIHQMADIDGRGQFLFWETARKAAEELGVDLKELAAVQQTASKKKGVQVNA